MCGRSGVGGGEDAAKDATSGGKVDAESRGVPRANGGAAGATGKKMAKSKPKTKAKTSRVA